MGLLWDEFRHAVPLIFHGDPTLWKIISFTIQVAVVATACAAVIGLPIALLIGLGRFPGRRALQVLANASLALPPVVVGFILFLLFVPQGPLGGLHLTSPAGRCSSRRRCSRCPTSSRSARPRSRACRPGCSGRPACSAPVALQLSALALREARIGVMAALIASLGTSLSEVGAIVIVGGNVYGYDQTLASSTLYYVNQSRYEYAVAAGLVLIVLILLLMGSLSLLQHQGGGLRLRFRTAPAM